MANTYSCRLCGEPIIFRYPKQDDQEDDRKKKPPLRRKPRPIHIYGGRCGERFRRK